VLIHRHFSPALPPHRYRFTPALPPVWNRFSPIRNRLFHATNLSTHSPTITYQSQPLPKPSFFPESLPVSSFIAHRSSFITHRFPLLIPRFPSHFANRPICFSISCRRCTESRLGSSAGSASSYRSASLN